MPRQGKFNTILSAAAATGVGTEIDVSAAKWIAIEILSYGGAAFTIKTQGSVDASHPTFSSAASESNPWSRIGMYDMDDGSFVAGSTGVVIAANSVKTFKVNVDMLHYFNMEISAYTSGNATIKAYAINEIYS